MPADRTYEAGPSRPRPHARPGADGAHGNGKKKSYKTSTKSKAPSSVAGAFPEKHKPQAMEYRSADGLPGLNKIKAAIRQTTRLLNKPGLESGLKVQTQRRLESLQADLAKAERRDTEKKIGAKYHMVKFFERKKLLRIIKRQHKHIKKAEGTDDKASLAKAEETLRQARIMLNYIVHFSKSEKYISLFPSDSTEEDEHEDDGSKKIKLPPHLAPTHTVDESDTTAKRRLEILKQVEVLMQEGKLPLKPEEEKEDGKALGEVQLPAASGAEGKKSKSSAKKEEQAKKEEDDFFDSD